MCLSFQEKPQILPERNQIKVKYRETFPGLSRNALTDSSQRDLGVFWVFFLPFGAGGKQLGGLAHAGFALPFLFAKRVSLSGLAGGRRR